MLRAMAEVIRAEQLTKSYGHHRGIVDVGFSVQAGEVFGYLGPNGAGKSTTIRLLLDLIRPTSGRLSLFGLDSRRESVAIRKRLGYLPGDLRLYERMTGRELLDYFGHLRGAPGDGEQIAERLELDLDRRIKELSRGNRQKVGIAQAFMPGASGIEATPAVLEEAKDAKVLVLSMQDDPRYVREAFSAGASGYVLKEAADAEVVDAVREVARGGRYVHPALGARLIAAEAEERAEAEQDPLSDREREVLRLLALGHTNQEIAKMLYLSVRTVETHRAHIMQKLRLQTRAELVRYAIEHRLLEAPPE